MDVSAPGPQSGPQGVPICCIARSKWAGTRAVWREAGPAKPPISTRTAPAERLQRSVGVEHFDAGTDPRVDVEERLMACALSGVRWRPRCHHAALSEGSARAKPRR